MSAFLRVAPGGGLSAGLLPQDSDERVALLQELLGGTFAYYPEGYHEMLRYEVAHLDDWHGEAANPLAARLIGAPAMLYGPVLLIALPAGQTTAAERAHQRAWFRGQGLG